jgi:hypothetical protein
MVRLTVLTYTLLQVEGDREVTGVVWGPCASVCEVELFLLFFYYIVVLGVYCDIYKNSILVKFTASSIHFYPPPPVPGTVSTGLIFPFSYMST